MMETLPDHNSLITFLGGPPKVAETLGIESVNVRQWKARNRIPPEHWSRLIEAADRPDVGADWFLDTMPERKPPTTAERATSSDQAVAA